MAAIRGRDTGPERFVRKMLAELGIRYRLHVRTLPGTPDIVIRRLQKIIEVRGCFWHRHKGCRFSYMPKSRTEFWTEKFDRTVERDIKNEIALRKLGYDVLVVWECSTSDGKKLRRQLSEFVTGKRSKIG